MRAAAYIRVSTEDQAKEGYSIPAQRDRLTAYAASQEWEIFDYYVDDGFSAKDTKRPNFQRMIKDAQERRFDVILVHKLDRFTRNVRDLYDVLDRLTKWGVSFRSSLEQFDTTTTMGRAMIGMLGIFAQWERETIADRVYWGMEQKIISGKRNGSSAPMGFDLVEGKLVPNEDVEFVQRLFRMYLENKGMPTIVKILSSEGRPIHIRTLWYILKNPIYCGEYRWNFRSKGIRTHNPIVVEGDIEPIVSKEDFYKVQELTKSRDKKGRAATSDYIFSGILKCDRCGYAMTGGIRHRKEGSRMFYRCSGKIGFGNCDMPIIGEEAVEEAFFKILDYDKKELSMKLKVDELPKSRKDSTGILKQIDQIKKRREKWRTAFVNDLITMEELKKYSDQEKEKENDLIQELEDLKNSSDTLRTPSELYALFKDIKRAWYDISDRTSKKMFINDIFSDIVINSDSTLPGRGNSFGCVVTRWKTID